MSPGFQRAAPPRPTTVLQYKKTAKEMRAKYPEGGKVPYVLTKDAPPHGVAGDVLKVNRGFANNYLAPQGLGEPASAEVIAAFEVKLAERAGPRPQHMMRPRPKRSSSSPRATCPSAARRARTARSRPCRPRTCSRCWGSTRRPRSRSRRWTASTTGHRHFTQAGEGRAAAEARRSLRGDPSNILLACAPGPSSRLRRDGVVQVERNFIPRQEMGTAGRMTGTPRIMPSKSSFLAPG